MFLTATARFVLIAPASETRIKRASVLKLAFLGRLWDRESGKEYADLQPTVLGNGRIMLPFHTHNGCDLVYGFWSVPLPFNWTRGTRRAVRVRADATSSL